MTGIINAAPMAHLLGIQDLSTRVVPMEPEAIPQHLPKIYTYAKKGPTSPQLVVGNSRARMYGAETFDLRKKWATHQTVLANLVNAQGNIVMMERLKPADAGPEASIRFYLDVLPTFLPVYERNTDGSLKLDADLKPIPTGDTVEGFKVKFIKDIVGLDEDGESTWGVAARLPGTMVDEDTSVQSQRYPILEFRAPDFGYYGNLNGVRIWAPTTQSNIAVDQGVVAEAKAYPFRFSFVSKNDDNSTPGIVSTLAGEQYIDAVFKPGTINTRTDQMVYVGDNLIQAYQDLQDPALPPQYGPFGAMHVYQNNIDELVGLFYEKELPVAGAFSDFTGEEDEAYRFNFLTGVSSQNVPYTSFVVDNSAADAFRFTENTTAYGEGGSDGTMNETLFGQLVAERVREYADPQSQLQNVARNPESIIYDSGFPLETKYALIDFISLRKDTAVVLSTHTVGQPELTASQESSLAIALKARLQMYPESEFYGTPVVRGMVVGRCGTLMNSQYPKKLPITLEIAHKAAAYMGAGNGEWTPGARFDSAPGSIIQLFRDVNVTFTPASVKVKDWANGLVWVESYNRRSLYIPALKTVYDNDTSVLNSFFTMLACCECQKVALRAQREFSGDATRTNAQLAADAKEFIENNTSGRFDNRFVIVPEIYYTDADLARGYSFSGKINVYAPNMKTVATMSVVARRIEDLQQ